MKKSEIESLTYQRARTACKKAGIPANGKKVELIERLIDHHFPSNRAPSKDAPSPSRVVVETTPFPPMDAKKHHEPSCELCDLLWENRKELLDQGCLIKLAVHPKTGTAWGIRGSAISFKDMIAVFGDKESAREVEQMFRRGGYALNSTFLCSRSGTDGGYQSRKGSPSAKKADKKMKKAVELARIDVENGDDPHR